MPPQSYPSINNKNRRRTMKTKILSPLRRDGYKARMIMMLIALSTMMLNIACSSDDDLAANNNEITNKKGFEIPVTINVTRQGDATTRASFDGSKLNFSAGDKLFVYSYNGGGSAGAYAGVLDWVSDGTFSGTITTKNPYTGTIDALLSGGNRATAVLLPAGYGDYGYLSTEGNVGAYNDEFRDDYKKAFVASTTEKTAKALAVEQFSFESATYKSGGFALSPQNAILNFTITGLTASTNVTATIKEGEDVLVSGSVTTDGSGTATFAMGIGGSGEINPLTLTVGGKEITITSTNTVFTAGKIYNVTRGTGGTVDLSTKNTAYTAQNGETLTGILVSNVKISIADGATVILHNVNINGSGTWTTGNYAGITCEGDATIILSGTNTVKGIESHYPGIYVPENKTVTIQGTGSLTASSNGYGAGIGGGSGACGNITITGGNITATGGNGRAGIGCGTGACGNITITGGTITATGGNAAAGIGGSNTGNCGDITITSGVTRVTATKGNNAPNSIGAGYIGTCGTVKFGTQTMYDGSSWTTTPTSGSTYGGLSLTISQTTYANDTWTLTPVLP